MPINSAYPRAIGIKQRILFLNKNYSIGFVLLIALLLTSTLSNAQLTNIPLILDDKLSSKNLAPHIEVLKDTTNALTVEELIENGSRFGFEPVEGSVINYGYTNSTYWIRFTLQFKTRYKENWYLRLPDPLMDTAELYIIDSKGGLIKQSAGENTPHAEREIQTRFPTFQINGFPNETVNGYLKLHSKDPIQVALSIHSQKAYSEETFNEVLALGAYYGIIFVMLCYNLFIYVITREKAYLTYCLYLAVLFPAQLGFDGLSYQYLWPDSPWWANRSIVFFSGAVALFGTLFARVFLNTKEVVPLWDKVLIAHTFAAISVMPIALIAPYSLAATCGVSIAVSFASVMLLTALIGFFRNAPNARFFLIAWLTFTLGLLIRALVATGQIEATLITMYAAQFGTALETVLLSFALADRIKGIEREKQEAQQQAADALERSNLELQRSNQIKDEFLATISHELRTPMNGIQGMLDLLNSTNIDSKQNEYIGYAQLSTKEMLKHIESILCFSEAQSKRVKIKHVPFQLSHLIQDLSNEFENRCKQKYIEFRIHKASNLPNAVEGDPQQLRLVLSNLLDNAVKFTDAGFVELGVSCEVDKSDNSNLKLTFQITDSGCGIPSHATENIFKPFNQVDNSFSRRHGGLGIGLALSQSLAEALKGNIQHKTNAPTGSIFSFTTPLKQGDERDSCSFGEPTKRADDAVEERNPTILVVEDNLVNQKVISAILKKKDYQVLTAINGEEALKILDKSRVDLILMDCQMPVMDGFEASLKIRERKAKYGYPPIIAVTANAMSEDRDRCINSGMNDYLTKPVDRYKLYTTIEEWLKYEPISTQKSA